MGAQWASVLHPLGVWVGPSSYSRNAGEIPLQIEAGHRIDSWDVYRPGGEYIGHFCKVPWNGGTFATWRKTRYSDPCLADGGYMLGHFKTKRAAIARIVREEEFNPHIPEWQQRKLDRAADDAAQVKGKQKVIPLVVAKGRR